MTALELADTLELCRHARRVRSRMSDSPGQMHATLRSLVTRPPTMRITPPPVPVQEQAKARFVREVIERLDGPVLRYSNRLDLYKIARRLGLGLFDANLLIAQVQYRAGGATAIPERNPAPPSSLSRLGSLILVILLQCGILSAAWAIFS